jgi:hypothetical protein
LWFLLTSLFLLSSFFYFVFQRPSRNFVAAGGTFFFFESREALSFFVGCCSRANEDDDDEAAAWSLLLFLRGKSISGLLTRTEVSTLIVLTVNEKSFTCKRCDLSKTACDPFERRTKKVHDEKIYFLHINK